MRQLIEYFWQLLLLRRGPQDAPSSVALLQLLIGLNLVVNALLGRAIFGGLGRALGAEVIELLVSAALLFAALQVRERAARWRQSYIALLGAGVMMGLLALAYRSLAALIGTEMLADAVAMTLFFWGLAVLGHILRHALEISLAFGILLAFAYTMFLLGLIAQWLPPGLVSQTN
ncbi:MAG: hypothetical protein D6720_02775 [Gammaproteobacteria bacterium]|nr:MAG: hypothetical protein D6720_02775 [Gammaproteobacteria bacterium]